MPAIWTPPITWNPGYLVTAGDLNAQLRDNLEFLKAPPFASFIANEGSDYTTTSGSFVNVDNTAGKFNLTLVTYGGPVLVCFSGNIIRSTSPQRVYFDVELDGVRLAGDDGILGIGDPSNISPGTPVTLLWWKTGLAAGSHTFKLQWRTTTGTATLYAGAGTSNADLHAQFWVKELS